MKIAIVLNTSWNIYNFRSGLVRSFVAQGHDVTAISPVDHYTEKLRELGCRHIPVRMDSRGANPVKDLLLVGELFRIYRRLKPDVILHYTIKPNIYGTLASAVLGIPSINNVCGLGTMFLKDNLVSRVAILLYRLAFRFPKKIFFQNEDDLQLFLGKKMVRKNLCDLVPGSGIDLEKFAPHGETGNHTFTFLVISRLIYDKGILEYVEAVEKLKNKGVNARFQLLGAVDEKHKRGIPRKILDRWTSRELVEYLGTTEDVIPYIRSADCVVLPSYREGTPKTLLEAASLGKPLVATDVPGCRNVVEDGFNGFLCRARSSDDLADKLERMVLLEEETRQQMGINSRQKIEHTFDEKFVIHKYHDAIRHI
jgi:glycosyltransferase involved in cell wall biosynthesis